MKSVWSFLTLLLALSFQAHSSNLPSGLGEDEVLSLQSLNLVSSTFENLNSSSIFDDCRYENSQRPCPKFLFDSVEKKYSEGWVLGKIDRIFNQGRHRNPRVVCQSALSHFFDESQEKFNLSNLNTQLQQVYPDQSTLMDYGMSCDFLLPDSQVPPHDRTLAQAFMMMDFSTKKNRVHQSLKDHYRAKLSLDEILDVSEQDQFNCLTLPKKMQSECLKIQSCQEEGQSDEFSFFDFKVQEIQVALEALQKLKLELEKLKVGPGRSLMGREDQAEKIQQGIERIYALNPALNSSEFRSFKQQVRNPRTEFDSKEIENSLNDFLQVQRLSFEDSFEDHTQALSCLKGIGGDCDKLDEVLEQSPYLEAHNIFYSPESGEVLSELSGMNNYYSCIKSQKESHSQTDQILTEASIGLGLSLTPMGALNALRAARTAQNAVQINRSLRGVEALSIGADMAYGGYMTHQIYESCQKSQQVIEQTLDEGLSCQSQHHQMVALSNLSQCSAQLVLSAALMTPVRLNSINLIAQPQSTFRSTQQASRHVDRQVVLRNSQLNNDQRRQEATRLLGIDELSPAQAQALQRAHEIGQGGVYHYSRTELRQKVQVLNQHFTQEQTNRLIRYGIAGRTPVPESARALFRKPLDEFTEPLLVGAQRSQKQYNYIRNNVSDSELQAIHEVIRSQVGREGYYRAVPYQTLREILRDGRTQRGDYFSKATTGPHVGHNGSSAYLKCTRNCQGRFESASTGSGTQATEGIPNSELEVIFPDYESAFYHVTGRSLPQL